MGNCQRRAAPLFAAPLFARARDPVRVRNLWLRAVRRIVHILRIRRRWAIVGLALQEPRLQAIFEGLERRRGVLVRVLPKAKARVFRRR